jgi:hypothetical protein
VGDISVTIDAHQFRFFDMELVCNPHMMGFIHFPPSHWFVTTQTVVIDSFIRIKKSGEELTGFGVAMDT